MEDFSELRIGIGCTFSYFPKVLVLADGFGRVFFSSFVKLKLYTETSLF